MKTIKLIPLALALALFSCSQEETKKKETSKKETTEDKTEHNHDHEEGTLHLVDGQKWQVNKETTKGVENMTEIVNRFDVMADEKKYLQLFDSLDAEFRFIFKKCSVEGEAHDQLHIMLFPLRGMFNDLKSPEGEIRKQAVEKIKNQLVKYPEYFETNGD